VDKVNENHTSPATVWPGKQLKFEADCSKVISEQLISMLVNM
jgi:hypothetical protein